MKRNVKFFIFLLVFTLMGCAGSSKYMTAATPPEGPSPNKALVYFMRPSGLGFAIHFQKNGTLHRKPINTGVHEDISNYPFCLTG